MEAETKVTSPASRSPESKDAQPVQKRSSMKRIVVISIASAVLFIIIALGLGLGLGLGLKSNGHKLSPSKNGTTVSPSASNLPLGDESWRLDTTSNYNLDIDSWDLNAAPTTRTYNWTISQVTAWPDGIVRPMFLINGQYPGPVVRLNRGDRVVVNVTNELDEDTSIHWHGMYQNGTNWMDGTMGITQCGIAPNSNFVYNFTVEKQYGTYWYHAHAGTQYMDGLIGPLVIHAPEEAEAQKAYDADQVIVITDWYHNLSANYIDQYLAPDNENVEPVPDNGLIQGTNYFDCSNYDQGSGYTCYQNSSRAVFEIEQGKRYRLRLINAGGFAMFTFSVDNHTLEVIEADGTVTEPLAINKLDIATAQRYSVILAADQDATNYWMRAYMDENCFAANNAVLNPEVMAIVTYTNNSQALPLDSQSVGWDGDWNPLCTDLNSSLLIPSVAQKAPPADLFYKVEFAFQIGDNQVDKAYVNGTSWTMSSVPTLNTVVTGLSADDASFNTSGVTSGYGLSDQFIISVPNYQVVDVLLTNFDDGSHPFHLHGHTFWVMATSSEQYFDYDTYDTLNVTNPMRRDTVMVESFSWALIRFVSDNPGLWAFHCHIAWHLEAGLMFQFQTRNDIMKDWVIPDDVLGLCNSSSSTR